MDGIDGTSAYSLVTSPFLVPAVSAAVTAFVNSSNWMVVGQEVVAGVGAFGGSGGPATFKVSSILSSQSVSLTFLGYAGDVSPGATIGSKSTIAPAGVLSSLVAPLSVIGAGTNYQLTVTPALIALGTTTPSLTISSAGTWQLHFRAKFNYTGATFAAVQAITAILHRTNNSAGDIANSAGILPTQIVTTYTKDAGTVTCTLPYTTTNANDILQVWASVSTAPSAGSIDCSACELYTLKLF